jgi:DNA-binding beta-propeller fold protein YncE/mono/diheme cytochrome c family protein
MQAALLILAVTGSAPYAEPTFQVTTLEDGYARPRALAVSGDKLFAALSTSNEVTVLSGARVERKIPVCRFPEALAALPAGRVLVSCRFDPDLQIIDADGSRERIAAGPEHGHRGLAVDPSARFAVVASPALGGVKLIDLQQRSVVQTVATGDSPRAVRFEGELLLVSNFISHTVTVHRLANGRLTQPLQSLKTAAGVRDLIVAGGKLWLLTHEDRAVDRSKGSVEGLDSVLLVHARGKDTPFATERESLNLTERAGEPIVKLDAVAFDAKTNTLAVAGSASDNVLLIPVGAPEKARAVSVGTAPAALAFLSDGRVAVADRLSDTLSFVGKTVETVAVGKPERTSPAALGELLFYGRALVPNNVATGGKSIYACSACHEEGHVDGRLHPAKKNRFFSMTKSCRGIGTTSPYLSLGNLATLPVFADNIVSTHAQGADVDPDTFDKYPVVLRTRAQDKWLETTLTSSDVRTALTAYMAVIPPEPSPHVAPGATTLSAEARRGESLFLKSCARCHLPVGNTALKNRPADLEASVLRGEVTFAGKALNDVGTPVLGEGGNNPPSLRGVWEAGPWFNDGSATTLEQVLERTNPRTKKVHAPLASGTSPKMNAADREDLAAFLRSL